MRVVNRLRLLLCFLPLLVGPAAHAVEIKSGFDVDLEGWTTIGNGAGAPVHVASGGNPDGYMQIEDVTPGAYIHVAPVAFHGDLTSFIGGSMAFDGRLVADPLAGVPSPTAGEVTIRNGGDSMTLDFIAGDFRTFWTSYAAPLTAEAWGATETDWTNLLSNVTAIEVRYEPIESPAWPDEVTGFDNFRINSDPPPDPDLSSTPPCIVISPDGQPGIDVVVRDRTGAPVAFSLIYLIFNTGCEDLRACDGFTAQRVAFADANGLFTFQPEMGGCCAIEHAVEVRADGILLNSYDVISSPDNGSPADLVVDLFDFWRFINAFDTGDTCFDFTCDGGVGLADLLLYECSFLEECPLPKAAIDEDPALEAFVPKGGE